MKRLIHTPEGVRDIIGQECDKKRYLERKIDKLFRSYGYQSIETPSFEFFDVFGKEVGTTPSKDLYKFFDREGNTLVLRPDFTPSIARSVSMHFAEEQMPIRLSYRGNAFINNSSYQGRLKESTQMGVELIQDASVEADAEVIALVAAVLKKAGLNEFQISVGEVEFFHSLTREAGLDEDVVTELRLLLDGKNRFGAQELIAKQKLRPDLEAVLQALPDLFGGVDVLAKAKTMTTNPVALGAIARLEKIYEIVSYYGCQEYVSFDLSTVSSHDYYTGIIFQAYTYGTGDAVIRGGRYDKLLEHFGKDAPAVGFVCEVDSMLNAIERQGIRLPIEDIKTMVLYPAHLEKQAICFAGAHREKNMEVACVRFAPDKVLDDYKAYGRRNQFGGIIYFRTETEVFAINLSTDEVQPVDITEYVK